MARKGEIALDKIPPGTAPGKLSNRYPDEFVRQVRTLWASGRFNSDKAIIEFTGMPIKGASQTIGYWRKHDMPDGVPWEEFRRRIAEKSLQDAEAQLVETFAEMNKRHLQALATAFTGGVTAVLMDREEITIETPEGTRKYRVPKIRPKNFRELVESAATLVRTERLIRGGATERIEQTERAAELFASALELAGIPPEQRERIAEALEKLAGAGVAARLEGEPALPEEGLDELEEG